LILLRRSNINQKNFRKFKNYIFYFLVKEKRLFRKINKNISLRKIVNRTKDKNRIVKSLHNKNNYKKRKNIYRRIAN